MEFIGYIANEGSFLSLIPHIQIISKNHLTLSSKYILNLTISYHLASFHSDLSHYHPLPLALSGPFKRYMLLCPAAQNTPLSSLIPSEEKAKPLKCFTKPFPFDLLHPPPYSFCSNSTDPFAVSRKCQSCFQLRTSSFVLPFA